MVTSAPAFSASLVYVAIQLRNQTIEARLAATRHLADTFLKAVDGIAHDRVLMDIYRKGQTDYDALEDVERLQLSFWLVEMFRIMEQVHLHRTTSSAERLFVSSLQRAIEEFLEPPGIQRWWERSRNMFDPTFCGYVDETINQIRKGA